MKIGYILASMLAVVVSQNSVASCGPPECCYRPHICGRGPEFEKFSAAESICLQKAAASVDGKIQLNPAGYPHSIWNDRYEEMARVYWAENICSVKYSGRYHR